MLQICHRYHVWCFLLVDTKKSLIFLLYTVCIFGRKSGPHWRCCI